MEKSAEIDIFRCNSIFGNWPLSVSHQVKRSDFHFCPLLLFWLLLTVCCPFVENRCEIVFQTFCLNQNIPNIVDQLKTFTGNCIFRALRDSSSCLAVSDWVSW